MPEPTVDNQPINPIELRHGPKYDIVLNRTAGNQSAVDSLAGLLSDGLPQTWMPYRSPHGFGRNSLYVDNLDIPKYIAKVRPLATPNPQTGEIDFSRPLNSIFHEMVLSPKINQVLSSEEAVNLAQRNGLHPIEFLAPLVGLIDQNSGAETLVYRFVPDDPDSYVVHHLTPLADKLRKVFADQGIYSGDLVRNQFIVAYGFNGRKLYLVDAEEFTEIPISA